MQHTFSLAFLFMTHPWLNLLHQTLFYRAKAAAATCFAKCDKDSQWHTPVDFFHGFLKTVNSLYTYPKLLRYCWLKQKHIFSRNCHASRLNPFCLMDSFCPCMPLSFEPSIDIHTRPLTWVFSTITGHDPHTNFNSYLHSHIYIYNFLYNYPKYLRYKITGAWYTME